MEIIRYELGKSAAPGWERTIPVITIGNFDGVHLGHQEIFRRVKRRAEERHGKAVVFTFEPHPLKVLRPDKCPPLITPYPKRIRLIQHFGMDAVVVAKFTREFAALDPEIFFNILRDAFNVKAIYIGYDFSFGRDRKGSVEKLKAFGGRNGVDVEVVEPITLNGVPVSSTQIRRLVAEGDMRAARAFLGRYFFLSGEVIEGHKRGQRFGFPTANIETGYELLPPRGVYATFLFHRGKRYRAATNLGVNPTFDSGKMSIESYILDFDGSLYGEEVSVSFVEKIRDEICFSTVEALVDQIKTDVERVNEILEREERENPQESPEG